MSETSTSSLPPSPYQSAFSRIPWESSSLDSLLKWSTVERTLWKHAENHALDYIVADVDDASAYSTLLLKLLDQVTGPSSSIAATLSRVQESSSEVTEEEIAEWLHTDLSGIVRHVVLQKLHETLCLLKESSTTHNVSIHHMFYSPLDGTLTQEWRPLLRILYMGGGTGDPFGQRAAALCLGMILRAGCPSQQRQSSTFTFSRSSTLSNPVEEPLQALTSWLVSRLQSSASSGLAVVTPTLVVLATCPEARRVLDQMGGIGYLSRHLRRVSETNSSSSDQKKRSGQISVQQIYELCFCLWTMTFELDADDDSSDNTDIVNHFHRDGAVVALCELVQLAPREKVVRLALSALVNLAKSPSHGKSLLREMIGCQLLSSIETQRAQSRKSNDPELQQDLDFLCKKLKEQYKEMTNWDVYKAEIESGHLQWGMVHSEAFFRQHAKLMEAGDFELLKRLVHIIGQEEYQSGNDDDDTTLAIALYDVGEFVRHYPNGRAIVKRFRGAKQMIMSKMDHENEVVARMALQCVSKLMVQNWQAAVKDSII